MKSRMTDETRETAVGRSSGAVPWPLTTQTLLDGLRCGTKADWDKFWRRYEGPLSIFIKIKLIQLGKYKSKDDVKECLGVVYLRLYKQVANYDVRKGRFRNFLCTLVRNEMFDALRKNNRIRKYESLVEGSKNDDGESVGGPIENLVDEAPLPGNDLEENELWDFALAISVWKYVVSRFQWSPCERQIINKLQENYREGDMGRGLVKHIAGKLNCTAAMVSKTRDRLHQDYERVMSRYRQENLMQQKSDQTGMTIEQMALSRFNSLLLARSSAR